MTSAMEIEMSLPADSGVGGRWDVSRRHGPRRIPVLGDLLFRLYGHGGRGVRNLILRVLYRFEGGSAFSLTLRRIFAAHHGIEAGMYSHGGWAVPENIAPGTKIGRYCSIAMTAHIFTLNHPMNTRSTSPLFFNPSFGLVDHDLARRTLTIGNDVWIGHNAIILPSVSSIGDGAVIGAGAVVNKDIPPYAIVTGYPCRIVGYRFPRKTIEELLASRWWDKPLDELLLDLPSFTRPIEDVGGGE